MAMQAGSLIQDQNFNARYNGASVGGKSNVLKAQRKAGLGGRKPLGDLSNSGKPAPLNQATKKLSSKNLAFIDEDSGVSKLRNDTNKKKGISKVFETVQAGNRKALSDISNSGKARLNEAPKKNLKMKLSAVAEEQLHQPNAIAEEQFLHNHHECTKAQRKAMDVDEFLKTIGLDNGNIELSTHPNYFAFPRALPVSSKTKIESPLKYHLDLEEMAEQVIEDGGSSWKHELLPYNTASPSCKTPKSVCHFTFCNDYDFINFKLMETPELRRH